MNQYRFRPLDGESISKLKEYCDEYMGFSFRPLDGESISKPRLQSLAILQCQAEMFPSPRRGINF